MGPHRVGHDWTAPHAQCSKMPDNTSEKLRPLSSPQLFSKVVIFMEILACSRIYNFSGSFLGRDSGLQKVACVINLVLIYEKSGRAGGRLNVSPRAGLSQGLGATSAQDGRAAVAHGDGPSPPP